jgi:hypothetical protein
MKSKARSVVVSAVDYGSMTQASWQAFASLPRSPACTHSLGASRQNQRTGWRIKANVCPKTASFIDALSTMDDQARTASEQDAEVTPNYFIVHDADGQARWPTSIMDSAYTP